MFFCKECSRLLDEDLKICPYCGAQDMDFDPEKEAQTDRKIEEINRIMDKQKEQPVQPEPPTPPAPQPAPNVIYDTRAGYEEIRGGIRVALILLSIFISPVGLIVGIVYMTGLNPAKKKMGKVMLIISIISLVLSILCCCAILGLGLFYGEVIDTNYYGY